MKKRDIPQPKYGMGDKVLFTIPSEGNYSPRRDVGEICEIQIRITQAGYSIRYGFVDHEDSYDEGSISRRVLACQSR